HVVSDASDRPFSCPYDDCDKRFQQKHTMEVHVAAIHTGEKNHVCPVSDCGAAFADPSALARHRK
ncbi:hypothetical protein BD626DRAFT_390333, partial [Schizophyllum amplum]